ncbi:MAG: type II toxin-antitoxin system PemK/MazF family toxin [Candidatus Acidiferrum sp.]|jgi:mRNA-degrading endonuclease toxin of MazEF toxin-antitoxin module
MASTVIPTLPKPSQGEIWVIKLPIQPPDKGLRYVIVVSSDAQNHHPRASTVVVVPIGTTLRRSSCLQLAPGQTGLTETSEVWANAITTVAKKDLRQPRNPLRTLSRGTVIKILRCVVRAMGVLPSEMTE